MAHRTYCVLTGGDGLIRTGDRGFADLRLSPLATSPNTFENVQHRRNSNKSPSLPVRQGKTEPVFDDPEGLIRCIGIAEDAEVFRADRRELLQQRSPHPLDKVLPEIRTDQNDREAAQGVGTSEIVLRIREAIW